MTKSKCFDVWIDEVNQLQLSTQTGALIVLATLRTKHGPPGALVQFHFDPPVARQLYDALVQVQQTLEKVAEGTPPTDTRH